MQTILNMEIDNRVIVNNKIETVFIRDTFILCRKVVNNYIEVTVTIRDLDDAVFNMAYHLQFFAYPAKYSGWYVCSKVERYAPHKNNAVMMCIIPLIEDTKEDNE